MEKNMKVTCPNCGNINIDKWGSVSFASKAYSLRSSLCECLKCGLFFVHPRPDEKQLSKIYSGVYHYAPNKIKDLIVNTYVFLSDFSRDLNLIRFYKKRGRVLDIGAGRGDLISLLPAGAYEKWVYDPYLSKRDLKVLAAKVSRVNNFADLSGYQDKYFDVVILRNVIEHTAAFKTLIGQIYRILSTGGIIFIRTPNIDSADFRLLRTNWYEIKMPGHIIFFNTKSMRNVLTAAGFRVLHNGAVKRSMPLSFFRSVNTRIFPPFKLLLSLLFSLFSPLIGEGGDLLTIARR